MLSLWKESGPEFPGPDIQSICIDSLGQPSLPHQRTGSRPIPILPVLAVFSSEGLAVAVALKGSKSGSKGCAGIVPSHIALPGSHEGSLAISVLIAIAFVEFGIEDSKALLNTARK